MSWLPKSAVIFDSIYAIYCLRCGIPTANGGYVLFCTVRYLRIQDRFYCNKRTFSVNLPHDITSDGRLSNSIYIEVLQISSFVIL